MLPLVNNIKYLTNVWLSLARTSIVREMEFRGNFVLGIIRQFSWIAAFIFMVEIIFRNTSSLNGWSHAEMFIIVALSRMIEGTFDIFASRNIAMFPQAVQRGDFDLQLLKPLPSQFAVAFQRFHFYNIGNVLGGLMIFVYGLVNLPHYPSLLSWLAFAVLIIVSIVIYYSVMILIASLVFRLERMESLWGLVTLFTEPLAVPFDIFPRVPRLAITYIVPIAFVVFVPAQAITGKLAFWQLPVALVIACLFLWFANLAWKSGLGRYTSASS